MRGRSREARHRGSSVRVGRVAGTALVLATTCVTGVARAEEAPTTDTALPVQPQGMDENLVVPAPAAPEMVAEGAAAPKSKEEPIDPSVVPAPAAAAALPALGQETTPPEPLCGTGSGLVEAKDELAVAGYMPGYRRHVGLGMSPHAPRVGSALHGTTPSYAAPNRMDDWTFKWSGFMTMSLQTSIDQRPRTVDGQNETVLHTPPTTIDDYGSFVSTATVPGNWLGMSFSYGNPRVTAVTSIDTWNPSRPTTYYQLGSQYFINNAYLQITPGSVAGFAVKWNVGMFSASYGMLGRYGGGIYVNPIAGQIRGIGETLILSRPLSERLTLTLEHGLMTNRNGRAPDTVIASSANGWIRPSWAAAFIHHGHARLELKGDTTYQLEVHVLHNWANDDRVQTAEDNPVTREIDETDIPDGHVTSYAADLRAIDDAYGMLAVGAAYVTARASFPVKGLTTYGGDGEQLTQRWWGIPSYGTGKLLVLGANYSLSVAKLVLHPKSFGGDAPDIVLNAGVHVARTSTSYAPFDGRWRHKYGLDALYTLTRHLGVGARLDRVVPSSKNADETFHVLAGRLQLKTDWTSREAIQLIYAKWFYGDATRNEGTGERTPERMDDQLLALNFNMWW